MFGYQAARKVVEAGRAAIFGHADRDLPIRSEEALRASDLIPQFGFTGEKYETHRILFLGINPGNGPIDRQSAGDLRMMPALAVFAKNPTLENFIEAAGAYRNEALNWPIWKRHCSQIIDAGKISETEIAYSNTLPWRTASESGFQNDIAASTCRQYVRPLIEELRPKIIVTLGKRANEVATILGPLPATTIVWNRSQAATPTVLANRQDAAEQIFRLLQ